MDEAGGDCPTFFEGTTALAFQIFAAVDIDYGVVETGLGGLLDVTNTISRQDKVAVLTTIGLDHTEVLRPTSWSMKEECAAIPKRYRRLDRVLIKIQLGRVIVVNHTPPAAGRRGG